MKKVIRQPAPLFPASKEQAAKKIQVNKYAREAYNRLIQAGVTLPVVDYKVIPADLNEIYVTEATNPGSIYLWTQHSYFNAYNLSAYLFQTIIRPDLRPHIEVTPSINTKMARVGVPVGSLPVVIDALIKKGGEWDYTLDKEGNCVGLVLRQLPDYSRAAYDRWYTETIISEETNIAAFRPGYADVRVYQHLFRYMWQLLVAANHMDRDYKEALRPELVRGFIHCECEFRAMYDHPSDYPEVQEHYDTLTAELQRLAFVTRLAYEAGAIRSCNMGELLKTHALVMQGLARWQEAIKRQALWGEIQADEQEAARLKAERLELLRQQEADRQKRAKKEARKAYRAQKQAEAERKEPAEPAPAQPNQEKSS